MVKVDRLPSGSYRARVLDYTDPDGKAHYRSFTGKNKKAVQLEAAQFEASRKGTDRRIDMTVGEALERCIEAKANVISPSTLVAYRAYKNNYIRSLQKIKLSELTQEDVQVAINVEAARVSPKTIRNVHGLLSAAIKMFRPEMTLYTTLPQKEKPDITIPTEEHMISLFRETKGTEIEIPVLLGAVAGMRLSEIVGLKWENIDFKKGTIKVCSAIVRGENNSTVEKKPKTTAGFRVFGVPPHLINVLKEAYDPEEVYVTSLGSRVIYGRYVAVLKRVCPEAHYTFHELRHYAASVMIMLGIPVKYIADMLGHETEDMVNRVYGHIMQDKKDMVSERLNLYYKDVFQRCNF